MSIRVRIDFSVSFFLYGLLQRDLCKKYKRKQLDLKILFSVGFPHFCQASTLLDCRVQSI